jgi:hypothetical protein
MVKSFEASTTDGRVVISFPEASMPLAEKEAFISFLKSEWIARQSRFGESDAIALSAEVDSTWWHQNREKYTSQVGKA